MRRPLDDEERAFVAANRQKHIHLNLPGYGNLAGRYLWFLFFAGLIYLLFSLEWVSAAVGLIGCIGATWLWRQERQVVFERPTYWDPKSVAEWEVEENTLQVGGAMTVAGPPEDYETWLILRLEGDTAFVTRLTDIALADLSLPESVEDVAFSMLQLRKLEPRGPGLPARLDGKPVPSCDLDAESGTWAGPRKLHATMKLQRLPKWIRTALPGG